MAVSAGWRRFLPYALVLPSILVLIALIFYPMGFSLVNSFYFWNLQTSPVPLQYVGWQNYRLVLETTPFMPALRNTLLLSIGGTFVQFWFGMGIALLLNARLRGMGIMRALLIMPTTVAPIIVGYLFRYMYYGGSGLIPWLLNAVGFPVPDVGILGSNRLALAAIGLADVWQWTPLLRDCPLRWSVGDSGRGDRGCQGRRRVGVAALYRHPAPAQQPHGHHCADDSLHAAL